MYVVKKWIELDAGHRVPFHESKCCHIHGHRYRVTLSVEAEELIDPETGRSDSGMVMDFGILKEILMDYVHDPFDHQFLLWEKDPLVPILREYEGSTAGLRTLPCIPTAENLAEFWGGAIQEQLSRSFPVVTMTSLEVRETPTSTAIWIPPAS